MKDQKVKAKIIQKFISKYAPPDNLQQKEFLRQFRKCANIYAEVQGNKRNKLEQENAQLKRNLTNV